MKLDLTNIFNVVILVAMMRATLYSTMLLLFVVLSATSFVLRWITCVVYAALICHIKIHKSQIIYCFKNCHTNCFIWRTIIFSDIPYLSDKYSDAAVSILYILLQLLLNVELVYCNIFKLRGGASMSTFLGRSVGLSVCQTKF